MIPKGDTMSLWLIYVIVKKGVSPIARTCPDSPPAPWLGIDMDWPLETNTLGTVVTYNCPFMKKTNVEGLIGNYVCFLALTINHSNLNGRTWLAADATTYSSKEITDLGGRHSTEEAFALLTQPSRVRFSAPLSEWTAKINRQWDRTKKNKLLKKHLFRCYKGQYRHHKIKLTHYFSQRNEQCCLVSHILQLILQCILYF